KSRPDKERKQVKYALTKRLYEKGFQKVEVTNLYKFIDWLIGLPEPLELEYLHDIYEIEEAKKMAYISTAERLGMEKGIEKGIEQGIEIGEHKGVQKAAMALNMLNRDEDIQVIIKTTGLTAEEIELLKKSTTH